MVYQIIAVLFFILAVIALAIAFKLLSNKKWIAGFLRGSAGILVLLVVAIAAFTGKDLYSYKSASSDNNLVVTVSFRKKDANDYIAEMQDTSGGFSSREVQGQQWQLSARLFAWPPLIAYVGLRTGYKLDSISGRFIELQLDQLVERKQPDSLNTAGFFDTWQFLNAHPAAMPLVSAHMATTGYVPMADGAIYEVVSTGQNLTVNAVNGAAKDAMKNW